MPSLPLRPAIFCTTSVALVIVLFVAMLAAPDRLNRYLLTTIQAVFMALQVVWTWQGLRFATRSLKARGRAERADTIQKLGLVALICLLLGVCPFMAYLLITAPFPDPARVPPIVNFCSAIAAIGMFGLFAAAGFAVGNAERASGIEKPNTLGIAIQFAYLIVFAPALYRRLKALGAPAHPAP